MPTRYSNLVHFCHAVFEIFNQDCLNIFAYSGRLEVVSDVIFGGSVEDIESTFCANFVIPAQPVFELFHLIIS